MFKIHSFFPLFNHFLSFFMLMFAAGAASLGDGGASVLDAVVGDDEADVTEDGADGANLEAGVDGGDADGTVVEDAAITAAADKTQKPGMTPEIAKALEALPDQKIAKAIKAKLYSGQQAEKALFGLKRDFPNGVQDVLKLKQAIDTQLGGAEGLRQVGEDLKAFRDLDSKWTKKDPALVNSLAAEYPDEFTAMMPHFISKYAEKSPEAYSKMYAGMVVSEINGQQIPQALHLLSEYLTTAGELNPEQGKAFLAKCSSIVGNINKWLGELNKIATTPVPDKGAPGSDKDKLRQTEADLREAKQFNREVNFDYTTFRDSLITQQLDAHLKAAKKILSPERREVVVERALKLLSKKMNANSDFRQTVEQYEKAKDRDGLVRFLKSRAGLALKGENGKPGIAIQAYQSLFGESSLGGKKKPEGEAGKVATNPGAGWTKIAKPPQAREISRSLTEAEGRKTGVGGYEEMIMKNKYVLNDGRKVFHD